MGYRQPVFESSKTVHGCEGKENLQPDAAGKRPMKIKEAIILHIRHLRALGRSYYTVRGTRYGLRDVCGFWKKAGRTILSIQEVKSLLDAPDMRTDRDYRNRIMLEILYDTAIRRAELSKIRLDDLDLDAGYIRIQGKGNKERVVLLD
jgi:integrase